MSVNPYQSPTVDLDCRTSGRWRLPTLLLLTVATAVGVWSFLALGPGGQFYTVLCYSSFVGYLAGRLGHQNHTNSAGMGWFCAGVAGMFYAVYIYPVLHNDFHDLSSLATAAQLPWLLAIVPSVVIGVTGRLLCHWWLVRQCKERKRVSDDAQQLLARDELSS